MKRSAKGSVTYGIRRTTKEEITSEVSFIEKHQLETVPRITDENKTSIQKELEEIIIENQQRRRKKIAKLFSYYIYLLQLTFKLINSAMHNKN